jgi:hypothetical protein
VSKKLVLKSLAAIAMAFPLLASAESQLTVGTGSAAAKLDFRVVIPRVLFLGVGTGSASSPLATDTTVNEVVFDYTNNPLAVNTGAAASTITGNMVPVRVFGNNGAVTITSTNSGNLVNGATPADTIAFTQISTASSNEADFPAPAANGGVVVPTRTGKVTRQAADWTFTYLNTVDAAAGTYTGRVTYTATMP